LTSDARDGQLGYRLVARSGRSRAAGN